MNAPSGSVRQVERYRDVVLDKGKTRIVREVLEVSPVPGNEVVHTHDPVAVREEAVHQVRPEETRRTGDENSHAGDPFGASGSTAGLPIE